VTLLIPRFAISTARLGLEILYRGHIFIASLPFPEKSPSQPADVIDRLHRQGLRALAESMTAVFGDFAEPVEWIEFRPGGRTNP